MIGLIVGHGRSTNGQWDSGTVNSQTGDKESDLMYNIVGAALPILKQYKEVYSDYDTGNDKNVIVCTDEANSLDLEMYVSLHCDWEQAGSGTLPIVYYGSSEGRRIAECLNASVKLRMGLDTRGILERDDMEIERTTMPACIFETGSISADLGILKDYTRYGQAIAYGILDYLGISYSEIDQPTPPQPQPNNPYGFVSIFNSEYYLSYGDGPNDVILQFQKDCNFCGYEGENGRLDEDSYFGSECVHATKCIQSFHGLSQDGDFGYNSDICHMTEIATIQEALKRAGYDIPVDGASGPVTSNALVDFQSKNGLEPDGICGPKTRALLGVQ